MRKNRRIEESPRITLQAPEVPMEASAGQRQRMDELCTLPMDGVEEWMGWMKGRSISIKRIRNAPVIKQQWQDLSLKYLKPNAVLGFGSQP